MQDYTKQLYAADITARPILNDISIVIPTVGRAVLETCLYYIAHGSAWPARIIVVDQGPNPDVEHWLALLKRAGLSTHHVQSTQRGRASGVNRGLEQVDTHFVAITDDDCFVEACWLENIASSLRSNPVSIVTGRVLQEGNERVLMQVTSEEAATYHKPRLTFDTLSGGNMGTSTAVLQLVGILDEDSTVRCAEDGEWAYRALRAGVPVAYQPTITVRHFGWRAPEQWESQYYAYARSHGGFYGKYLRRGDWFIALRAAIHLARSGKRWIQGSLARDRETALNGRAYFTGLVPGMLAGWRRGPFT